MKLDGELWAGRCRFAAVGSLMGSSSLEGGRWYETAWRSLTFVVFDAPHAGGTSAAAGEGARPDRRHGAAGQVRCHASPPVHLPFPPPPPPPPVPAGASSLRR